MIETRVHINAKAIVYDEMEATLAVPSKRKCTEITRLARFFCSRICGISSIWNTLQCAKREEAQHTCMYEHHVVSCYSR